MNPTGPQKKIQGDQYRVTLEKNINGGGAKQDYDGMTYPRSTRPTSNYDKGNDFQGKVRGKTKHTYKAD